MIAEIPRMPLHRMRVVAAVQVLETQRDLLFLRIADHFLPRRDTVRRPFIIRDPRLPHARKRDHLRAPKLHRHINALAQRLRHRRMIRLVERPLRKPVTPDQRNIQAQLANQRIMLTPHALHRDQPDLLAMLRQLRRRHRIKRPAHDRLPDAPVPHLELRVRLRPRKLRRDRLRLQRPRRRRDRRELESRAT